MNARGWGALRRLLGVTALGLAAAGAQGASIRQVTPQGEAAAVTQVTVTFDEAVVPLGDLRQADPMALSCQGGAMAASSSRWLDGRQWVLDFSEPLAPGLRCTLQLRPGWKPSSGALTGPTEFRFATGAPAVVSVMPWPGSLIEEDQHFIVRLNGPVDEAAALARAGCAIDGLGDRVPVTVIKGAARDLLLKSQRQHRQADRVLVLACTRALPQDAKVQLVWGASAPGAGAAAGRAPQRFDFRVRPAFTAEFSCERERAQAPCLPIRPLTVRFSSPVARAAAEKAQLVAAGGAALAPSFDRDDKSAEVSSIAFPIPLAERTSFTLKLPPDLKDLAGRPLANAGSFPMTVATGDAPPLAKFAAAPFGVVELRGDPQAGPVLPVTLRHVQADLRPAAPAGQVRVLRLQDDAPLLAWYRKVQQHHETHRSAKALGLPAADWFERREETDARGRKVMRRVERMVHTREVSLLQQEPQAKRLDLPALAGGDPRPFEVVGIPLAEPGYHVVEIESGVLGRSLLDKPRPMFVRTGVLVTNLGVHFKRGRERSVVWVTTLDRGQPVAQADVAVNDCNGKRLWQGRTDAQGVATIAETLELRGVRCTDDDALFVTARKADAKGVVDTAFVFSHWNRGIEPWRFNLPTSSAPQPDLRAHTVFDRTLLRAGETVSMKHFIRQQNAQGLGWVETARLPGQLKIIHEGSGEEFTQPLVWNGVRHALSTWVIPAAAKLGSYRVLLQRGPLEGRGPESFDAGSFRVEAFRVPLLDVRLTPPAGPVVAPAPVPVDIQLNFQAGGPVAQAPLNATALLRPRPWQPRGFEDVSFEPPRAAASRPREDEDEAGPDLRAGRLVADKVALATSRTGAARLTLRELPAVQGPSELVTEVSFNDPNGERQTATATIPVWPSAVMVGIRGNGWATSRGKTTVQTVALDTQGRPLAGQAVEVRGRLSQVVSTRKRMVGGFYAWDNRTDTQDLGVLCRGRTDERGVLACELQLETAGQVELIASARDSQSRLSQAATSVWVTRRGELWFEQDNDDRIDVLPEKRRYEPGETARLQVRMPYREATALVAIEREGVIDTRLVTLRGNDPTVEVKIEPGWAPNVYVSVLALRGRLREVPWYSFFTWGWREPLQWARTYWHEGRSYQAPTALVDLSKPSLKFGVAALEVGLAAHELQVSVTPDKPQYAVRDKAQVRIQVTQGGRPAAGAEVAFAAVDEGLLALRPNASWDLLHGLIRTRDWGVETSTAHSEIIGRRHYGRKAVAAGGGGGREGARELLDTLLLWAPRVVLDARGEARLEVPLNDALTTFRLVAVADAGVQQFGTGSASVRVTQDLQVLSGLPPLVRTGDRFTALVTLRNTTAREMNVRASLRGEVSPEAGPGVAGAASSSAAAPAATRPRALEFAPQQLKLAAGAALEVNWPVEVPAGAGRITWEVAAQDTAGGAVAGAQDRLRFSQRVLPATPVRVLQGSLLQLDGSSSLAVAAPADALKQADGTWQGGLAVTAQARLSGALPGVRRFFETYPYTCLEQQVSQAAGLRDAARWTALVNTLPTYLDRDGLAHYFPPRAEEAARGSDRLTAYVVAAAHEAGLALPGPLRERMLDGLVAYVEGRIERRFWSPRPDADVRKLAALEALARHGRAQPRMLGSLAITPAQWPTAAVIDWLSLLQRLDTVPDRARRMEEARQVLRSRINYSGTTLRFTTEEEDFWWWLMDSADANAARLVLTALGDPAWKDELPRLVLGSLGRQKQGAWLTTTANLWGALALDKFGKAYESSPPTGRTTATTLSPSAPMPPPSGQAASAIEWSRTPEGGRLMLPWPPAAGSLKLAQEGGGKPWITVQALAAVPLKAPLRAGYAVTRSVTAVEQKDKGRWSRGDILRVRLEIEALSDRTWVVVSDPVPAGATVLGSGLGRDAAVGATTAGRETPNLAVPSFEERGFDTLRSTFEMLPRGKHVLEYSLRLNNPGRFQLPPTRVEAMYAPESFGEAPNAALDVAP